MSLADELLADLEDDEEESMETEEHAELGDSETAETELSQSTAEHQDISNSSVKDVAKLFHSERLKDILRRITEFSGKPRKAEELQGPVEADPRQGHSGLLSCVCGRCDHCSQDQVDPGYDAVCWHEL